MLGELAGEEQAHAGLDLAGRQGGLLVVAAEKNKSNSQSSVIVFIK